MHQGSAAYDSHADPFLQDNAIRYRHDCQLCGEMGIYSRNAAVMPIFLCDFGHNHKVFLYMENEEPDKKNTWYNVGMIWELIM